jgi:cell division protein FtsB
LLLRQHWGRALATAIFLAAFFSNQGFRALVANWIELRGLRREIVALDAQEKEFSRRLKAMRGGDAALERMARKELGFVRKGEIEYRFTPPKREP